MKKMRKYLVAVRILVRARAAGVTVVTEAVGALGFGAQVSVNEWRDLWNEPGLLPFLASWTLLSSSERLCGPGPIPAMRGEESECLRIERSRLSVVVEGVIMSRADISYAFAYATCCWGSDT